MAKQKKKPLQGKIVCVTRAREQSPELCQLLQEEGAEVLALPLIEILPTNHREVLDEVLEQPGVYDWIVFTSRNGVNYFFKELYRSCEDIRSIAFARIACVGKGTAEAVASFHLRVDLLPGISDAEHLAEAMVETGSLDSARVLVVTGNRNREVLPKMLEKKGRAIVDVATVYETHLNDLSSDSAALAFRAKGADAILFTSGSTVESFVDQAESLELAQGSRFPKAFSIGPITSEVMKKAGIPVYAEAAEATLESLIDRLREKLVG